MPRCPGSKYTEGYKRNYSLGVTKTTTRQSTEGNVLNPSEGKLRGIIARYKKNYDELKRRWISEIESGSSRIEEKLYVDGVANSAYLVLDVCQKNPVRAEAKLKYSNGRIDDCGIISLS